MIYAQDLPQLEDVDVNEIMKAENEEVKKVQWTFSKIKKKNKNEKKGL